MNKMKNQNYEEELEKEIEELEKDIKLSKKSNSTYYLSYVPEKKRSLNKLKAKLKGYQIRKKEDKKIRDYVRGFADGTTKQIEICKEVIKKAKEHYNKKFIEDLRDFLKISRSFPECNEDRESFTFGEIKEVLKKLERCLE